MEFEWDATKNEANIIKHGLDFADAVALFENDVYAAKDTRKDYGEERWRGIGELHGRVFGGSMDGSGTREAQDHLPEAGE